jgi:hypothetical protein
MSKVYRLSPEVSENLARLDKNMYRFILISIFLSLIFHLALSVVVLDLAFTLFGTVLFGGIAFVFFRIERTRFEVWSSYEIELDDERMICRRFKKSPVEIHKDEITQLQELSDTDIFVRTKKRRKYIQVYSLLMQDHPEIKESLMKWHTIENRSLFEFQLKHYFFTIGLAFVPSCLFLFHFEFAGIIPFSLFAFALAMSYFYGLQKWPVVDSQLRQIAWTVLIPIPIFLLLIANAVAIQ